MWTKRSSPPGVLSTGDDLQTAVLLKFDNLCNRLLLQGGQLVRLCPTCGYIVALLDELLWP